jgi:FdhD protein
VAALAAALEASMIETHEGVAGVRYRAEGVEPVEDRLLREVPLQINLNGRPFSVTMRTPGADDALVRGLLFTEGIVSRDATGWQTTQRTNESGLATVAEVTIPEIYVCERFYDRRSLVSSSSCGLCGLKEWGDPDPDAAPLQARGALTPALVETALRGMRARQQAFEATGGCHAAGAFDAAGSVLAVAEDIGRHNAVDKVVGMMLADGRLGEASLLTVSGRISFEIVSKAYRAGIPAIAAVSAPSTLAVEMGRRLGIAILGFCRDGRATVYSHPERMG